MEHSTDFVSIVSVPRDYQSKGHIAPLGKVICCSGRKRRIPGSEDKRFLIMAAVSATVGKCLGLIIFSAQKIG